MTGKSKLSRKQRNAEGFIERKQKKFNKLKQDKLPSDSTPNTAQGDIYSGSEPNITAGLVWYPSYYDPACNPLPYYQMTEYPMINHSHLQWFGTPNRIIYASAREMASFNQAYWLSMPGGYPPYSCPGSIPSPVNSSWTPSPGSHEKGARGWNRSQSAHHENEPDQSPPANETSRLRGDAPEFIPAYKQQHETKGCEDGFPMTALDGSHSR
ncbi:hypothetical protein H112_00509 [Trichophyton rubrum D6]|uniref:Uncharacterized protein n=3 Tax=Trichophyton TaxID=5550 RepID=F2SZY3_TRIRC|nr:uncharacterized protein TERG_08122 [Trichophyton rubrum CBS 118892]EZF27404.1 hypothetical protein H100_00507 [Trichophyton rubrum MR850]EZF46531.1 hypothetical protein H102_00508 [Trichophyton rubrum CBS 100081]EZF57093.1 hypothetical protein H103_00508 [Trichophyton rubrum CBS 288.86]EZF67789.1 hypothetical protein H104_00498 [Trichophyton rubrum CBS 289.86]EZF78464.1 hypothetical protein H105_00496 [Trichophyton soudanense CBS 452.61]EZF89032.1 hypothetical protein H110_00512 [Trichophy